MNPLIAGGLINAGSSLIGKLFGSSGPSIGSQVRSQINAKMKMGEKYGINKLTMLGAPTTVMPPQEVGLGETIADMGHGLARAVASGQTSSERASSALALENAGLQNDFLREQIASIRARTARESAPPVPAVTSVPGLIPEKIIKPERTTGANVLGSPWESAPGTSNLGQIIEDRYGEGNPLSWPLGGLGMAHDYWWNVYSPSNPNSSVSRTYKWLTK